MLACPLGNYSPRSLACRQRPCGFGENRLYHGATDPRVFHTASRALALGGGVPSFVRILIACSPDDTVLGNERTCNKCMSFQPSLL